MSRQQTRRTDSEVLTIAEEALGNNLVWIADQCDLAIRQKDAETLRRLAELNNAWQIVCRQLKANTLDANKSTQVRVRDLVDQIGMTNPRPILHCVVCGDEGSANRGDYFSADPDYVFTCCEQPMELVLKQTCYQEGAQ